MSLLKKTWILIKNGEGVEKYKFLHVSLLFVSVNKIKEIESVIKQLCFIVF